MWQEVAWPFRYRPFPRERVGAHEGFLSCCADRALGHVARPGPLPSTFVTGNRLRRLGRESEHRAGLAPHTLLTQINVASIDRDDDGPGRRKVTPACC